MVTKGLNQTEKQNLLITASHMQQPGRRAEVLLGAQGSLVAEYIEEALRRGPYRVNAPIGRLLPLEELVRARRELAHEPHVLHAQDPGGVA